MTRPDADRSRAERLAWRRALGQSISGEDRRFLREYASPDPAETDPVERTIEAVRRLTHGDPHRATGAERRVLFEEVMSRRQGVRVPARSLRRFGLIGAAAAAPVAILMLLVLAPDRLPLDSDRGSDELVAVRGAVDSLPEAGLGISGVDGGGSEYEVVHGDGLCPRDALRFYLTVRDMRTPYYVLFGVQDVADPTWYVPAPQDEAPPELPELPVRTWMVPFEIETDGTRAGSLSVVCILSEEPISLERLEAAWRGADGEDVASRAAATGDTLSVGATRLLLEEIEILEDCGRRP